MHTVIIGGSGLIGLATAQRLCKQGSRVTIVSRRSPCATTHGASWLAGEISDAASLRGTLERLRPDNVVHLAAYLQFACEQDPETAIRVNVDGTLNVLEACRQLDIRRLVFGSSIAVYGERSDLMREDDPPPADIGLYGATKRLGEQLGIRYSSLYALEFVALRYSAVFGPGRSQSRGMSSVRQMLKATASGESVRITDASGDERAHFTHVSDAADATICALRQVAPAHHIYNVGGPYENYATLKEFHAAVRDIAPDAGTVTWLGRARSSGRLDISRLVDDLGFVPKVTLATGLRRDLESA